MQERSFSLSRDAFLDSNLNYLLLYIMLLGCRTHYVEEKHLWIAEVFLRDFREVPKAGKLGI